MSLIQKWTDPTTTPVITMGAALNALANAAAAESSDFDNGNSTARFQFLSLELVAAAATAPVADSLVSVYARYRMDGTNAEDASATRPPVQLLGSFAFANTTSSQRLVVPWTSVLPFPFTLYVVNNLGYALAASGNTLKAWAFTTELV